MNLHDTRRALAKQRAINKHLTRELRAEKMLVNALSALVWNPKDQKPSAIRRVRHALKHKSELQDGAPAHSFYPTGNHTAMKRAS